jgi:hypothetical protein
MSNVLFHERQGTSPWFPAGRAAHARLRRKNLRAEMSHVMLVSSAWSGYFAPTPTRLFGTRYREPKERSCGGHPLPDQVRSDPVCAIYDRQSLSSTDGRGSPLTQRAKADVPTAALRYSVCRRGMRRKLASRQIANPREAMAPEKRWLRPIRGSASTLSWRRVNCWDIMAAGRSGPATPQSDEHKQAVAGKGVCVGAEKERIS